MASVTVNSCCHLRYSSHIDGTSGPEDSDDGD